MWLSADKKIPELHYGFQNTPSLDPILGQFNWATRSLRIYWKFIYYGLIIYNRVSKMVSSLQVLQLKFYVNF
jgi:hypothetical protein